MDTTFYERNMLRFYIFRRNILKQSDAKAVTKAAVVRSALLAAWRYVRPVVDGFIWYKKGNIRVLR